MKIKKILSPFYHKKYFWWKMNVRHPMGMLDSFSLKNIFNYKMDLRLFNVFTSWEMSFICLFSEPLQTSNWSVLKCSIKKKYREKCDSPKRQIGKERINNMYLSGVLYFKFDLLKFIYSCKLVRIPFRKF